MNLFGLSRTSGRMRTYIEPDLEYVRDGHVIASNRAAKDRLPYGRDPHISVRRVHPLIRRKPHPVQDSPIQAFKIEVRRHAEHEAEPQGLRRSKEPKAGSRGRLPSRPRVDDVRVQYG